MKPIFDQKNKMIIGSVVLDHVKHRVINYIAVCGVNISYYAQNTTREREKCIICYPAKEVVEVEQNKLF
jgi:nitrate reductase beta subunit